MFLIKKRVNLQYRNILIQHGTKLHLTRYRNINGIHFYSRKKKNKKKDRSILMWVFLILVYEMPSY